MVSNVGTFYKMLNKLDGKEYMESYISYNVALISAMVKPSITLTIKKKDEKTFNLWNQYGKEVLSDINLNYGVLREAEEYLILLIYSEELLYKVFQRKENQKFLIDLGYKLSCTIDQMVKKLINRYSIYNCPHELGVFLGYPISDVKAFMNCSRENCLLCGYWKVYSNEEKAKKVFNIFDEIKEKAINYLTLKKESIELAAFLKKEFSNNQSLVF